MKVSFLFALSFFAITTVQSQCLLGDCFDGLGTYLYPSGAKYVGQFKNGKIEGKGTLYFSNGNIYRGNWKDYYREGEGELQFNDGSKYSGNFEKSKFEGHGVLLYPNGDKYEGNWKEDLSNGEGIYYFIDGDRYEGNFKDGDFDGFGTMFYKNGAKYQGNWANNKKHGEGKFFKVNGDEVAGVWQTGKFKKKDKVIVNNKPSENASYGTYLYNSGDKYVGELDNGEPKGKGELHYQNGDRYVGEWDFHAPHGKGVMYYHYGRTVGGLWSYGTLKEQETINGAPVATSPVDVDDDNKVKIRVLIVGVSNYIHMPALKFTDDDAYQVYAFYKSPEGGALPDDQIKVLIDDTATRENIIKEMRSTFLKADENDVVVLYFSGHGLDGAFLPFDYNGYENKLGHDEIKSIIEECKAKHKLVIADACHSGSLSAQSLWAAKSINQERMDVFYSEFENISGGLALLLSSKQEEYSLEDHGLRQGIFSHFLIKGLKGEANLNGDDFITIQEISNFVSQEVRNYTNNVQNPVINGKYNSRMPIAFRY